MRIYFDENFSIHLKNGFEAFQRGRPSEEFYVIHVTEEFGRGCPDEIWIPGVAQKHGCVITQDTNINRRKYQWELCKKNKVGMFFFKQPNKRYFDYWQWVSRVFKFWDHIKLTSMNPKPFGFAYHPFNNKPVEL